MTAFRHVLRIAGFVGGWLAVCLVGAKVLPPTRLPILGEKHDFLPAHAAEFDTVFVGSSRVYHGVVPVVFDTTLQSAGQKAHSFNFGMDGVWPPESFYWVREILRLHLPLRWVFIELIPVHPRPTQENIWTARSIRWHDWRHTLLAWRGLTEGEPRPFRENAGWFVLHGELFLHHLSCLSRASEWLAPRLQPDLQKVNRKEYALNTPWLGQQGFLPEPAAVMPPDKAADLRTNTTAYAKDLAPVPLPASLREELRDLVKAVRNTGAEPIFFITPSVNRPEHFTDLRAQGIDADLISFKDPVRFPSLYEPDLHFDSSHLNEAGARELSRLLAEQFAAHTKTP